MDVALLGRRWTESHTRGQGLARTCFLASVHFCASDFIVPTRVRVQGSKPGWRRCSRGSSSWEPSGRLVALGAAAEEHTFDYRPKQSTEMKASSEERDGLLATEQPVAVVWTRHLLLVAEKPWAGIVKQTQLPIYGELGGIRWLHYRETGIPHAS